MPEVDYSKIVEKFIDLVLSEKRGDELLVLNVDVVPDQMKRYCESFRQSDYADSVYFCTKVKQGMPNVDPKSQFVVLFRYGEPIVYSLTENKMALSLALMYPLFDMDEDLFDTFVRNIIIPKDGHETLILPPILTPWAFDEMEKKLREIVIECNGDFALYDLGPLVVIQRSVCGGSGGSVKLITPSLDEIVLDRDGIDSIILMAKKHFRKRVTEMATMMRKTTETLKRLMEQEGDNHQAGRNIER